MEKFIMFCFGIVVLSVAFLIFTLAISEVYEVISLYQ